MKKFIVKITSILGAGVILGSNLHAKSPGSTSMNFLKVGVGPRQIGMAEAATAIAEDVNASYYNPAGLGKMVSQQASFMYNLWIEEIYSQHASYAHPLAIGTFGLSLNYLSMEKIQGYDADANPLDKISVYDLSVIVSYGRDLSRCKIPGMFHLPKGLYAGLNIKFLQEKLANEKASAWATDIGTIYDTPLKGLSLGACLQNLGTEVKFIQEGYPLPLTLKLGIGFTKNMMGQPLTLAVDYNVPNDDKESFSLGGEYWVRNVLGLRAGYKNGQALGNGLCLGVGLKISFVELSYAFLGLGYLGNTHRMGLTIKLGKEARKILAERAYKKGTKYYAQERYSEAILQFSKVLEYEPDNKNALRMMKKTQDRIKNMQKK